jgi:multiple sugar transport system permease protein
MSQNINLNNRDRIESILSLYPERLNPFPLIGRISETKYWAYLMILPGLLLISVVVFYPVLNGIWLSFHKYNLLRIKQGQVWVGLEQFQKLFDDPIFWTSLVNTFMFGVANVVMPFLLGMIAALALHRITKGRAVFRTILLMPWFMPSVVAGHMWALLLDSRLGIINEILLQLGIIDSYHAWFADPTTAMIGVLFVGLWRGFPFFALLLLAGMQGIPSDLYEAASVDGANAWQKFKSITIPMLMPIILVAVTLRTIGVINSPDLFIILTGGGPGRATHVLSFFAFNTAFSELNFGYSAAISVMMLLIVTFFTVLYMRMVNPAQDGGK